MRGIQHRPECSQPEPVVKPEPWLMNIALSKCPECGRAAAIDPGPQRDDNQDQP